LTSGRDWHDLAAGGQNLAALRKPGHDFEMPTCCEICEHFLSREKQPQSARDVSEVVFGKRTVRLCRVHRFIAHQHHVTTLGGLRHLFRENRGRRSFLPRRAFDVASGVQDEQRASRGRRASDLEPHA
jgi:hypothetical protein